MDLYFLNRPQKPMCPNWNFGSSHGSRFPDLFFLGVQKGKIGPGYASGFI